MRNTFHVFALAVIAQNCAFLVDAENHTLGATGCCFLNGTHGEWTGLDDILDDDDMPDNVWATVPFRPLGQPEEPLEEEQPWDWPVHPWTRIDNRYAVENYDARENYFTTANPLFLWWNWGDRVTMQIRYLQYHDDGVDHARPTLLNAVTRQISRTHFDQVGYRLGPTTIQTDVNIPVVEVNRDLFNESFAAVQDYQFEEGCIFPRDVFNLVVSTIYHFRRAPTWRNSELFMAYTDRYLRDDIGGSTAFRDLEAAGVDFFSLELDNGRARPSIAIAYVRNEHSERPYPRVRAPIYADFAGDDVVNRDEWIRWLTVPDDVDIGVMNEGDGFENDALNGTHGEATNEDDVKGWKKVEEGKESKRPWKGLVLDDDFTFLANCDAFDNASVHSGKARSLKVVGRGSREQNERRRVKDRQEHKSQGESHKKKPGTPPAPSPHVAPTVAAPKKEPILKLPAYMDGATDDDGLSFGDFSDGYSEAEEETEPDLKRLIISPYYKYITDGKHFRTVDPGIHHLGGALYECEFGGEKFVSKAGYGWYETGDLLVAVSSTEEERFLLGCGQFPARSYRVDRHLIEKLQLLYPVTGNFSCTHAAQLLSRSVVGVDAYPTLIAECVLFHQHFALLSQDAAPLANFQSKAATMVGILHHPSFWVKKSEICSVPRTWHIKSRAKIVLKHVKHQVKLGTPDKNGLQVVKELPEHLQLTGSHDGSAEVDIGDGVKVKTTEIIHKLFEPVNDPQRIYKRSVFWRLRGETDFNLYSVNDYNAMCALKRVVGARDDEEILYSNQKRLWDQFDDSFLHEYFDELKQKVDARLSSHFGRELCILQEVSEHPIVEMFADNTFGRVAEVVGSISEYWHDVTDYAALYQRGMHHISCPDEREMIADIPHVKQALRKRIAERTVGAVRLTDFHRKVEFQVKKEWAKPGKNPRFYASYGDGALVAPEIPELLKIGLHGAKYYKMGNIDVQIYIMSKATSSSLPYCFAQIMASTARQNSIFACCYSDDMMIGGNVNGVPFAFNLDISSCDSSNCELVFGLTEDLLGIIDPRRAEVLVQQCRLPLQYKFKTGGLMEVKLPHPFEGSGTVLTTVLNHVASFLIMSSVCHTLAHNPVRDVVDVQDYVKLGAALVGHEVSIQDTGMVFEQLQFLKYSVARTESGGWVPYRNLGAILRSLGSVEGDLDHVKCNLQAARYKEMTWPERATHFIASVVKSYRNEPHNTLLDAVRSRFPPEAQVFDRLNTNTDSIEEVMAYKHAEDRSLCRLLDSSLELRYPGWNNLVGEVSDRVQRSKMFDEISHELITVIMKADYGL